MAGNSQQTDDEWASDEQQQGGPRRRSLIVAVGLIGLLAVAVGLFTLLRDDGGSATQATTDVTFGPEGDATTIAPVPPGGNPQVQASVDVGPAGSQVTVQGAGFKTGKDVRPVELHWDQTDGTPLKTVDGPRFSVPVTIPADAQALPDGHNIIAVQRTKAGKLLTQTSVRFFVPPPRGVTPKP